MASPPPPPAAPSTPPTPGGGGAGAGAGAGPQEEEEHEVVRVRVKKCEGFLQPEFRTFAMDPQITSLDVLQHILIRAFDLNGKKNFAISYLGRDKQGQDIYLPLMSDWDLSIAFAGASKPYLQLKIDIKPSEDSPLLEDWDIISPKDVISTDLLLVEKRSLAAAALPFTQSIISQVGRTLSKVQQALSWSYGEDVKPFKPPLSDSEFHTFLNHEGQLTKPAELRLRIFHGGVEPSLRKVVWRYLLNVYPDGLTGQERMDYMKRKTREYEQLKGEWEARASPEDLDFIRSNVLKDVLRTDRTHPYYAGSDDNPHLTALHDLLTTYAVTHPQISYCQGMSDIASPILAVMDNEAHTFICFCGIMKRLEGNFQVDGEVMSVKFSHLKLLLRHSDPEFYSYLLSRGADDLFFCYRWLLLELKREFAFEDALRMLEITWSSFPPDPPEKEVELLGLPARPGDSTQPVRRRHMLRPTCSFEAAGDRPCPPPVPEEKSLVKQSSFGEFKYYSTRNEDSSEDDTSPRSQRSMDEDEDCGSEHDPLIQTMNVAKSFSAPTLRAVTPPSRDLASSSTIVNEEGQSGEKKGDSVVHTPLSPSRVPVAPGAPTPPAAVSLPPPQEFGKGNPFVLFLCLAILLEHRDHIIKNNMDYNELAMHFDRLVRRHNLNKILHRAKALFANYLQSEVWDSEEGDEAAAESPATS
uniref:Rab-GAP TBC domain-containing protein n=1 Tax=Anolis carolinensis TaxID=28377 RepID=G1KF59_ANOCA|nr:PREDICTED: TBC1 domain family member 25 isoform X1 [Anolis carolinensis]|eukprot:XP_003216761.1 PREDICTED: TBC1 domain family member 25 isoform X1 [Anolis carolinensis]